MDDEIIKKLESIKNEDSPIEIRLYDYKNSRVAYKRLTYKEFLNIAAVLRIIKWTDLRVKQIHIKEILENLNKDYKDFENQLEKEMIEEQKYMIAGAMTYIKILTKHIEKIK